MKVGDVEIVPVVDVEAGDVIQSVLPEATPDRVRRLDWLVPTFCDPSGRLIAPVQGFLVRSGGATILVDAGVGDGKRRSEYPQWDGLRTGFLDRLRALGVEPADVSTVVCTHLHIDHVGWNTSFRDGSWEPTFPSAGYVFVGAEYEHRRAHQAEASPDLAAAFDDSVQPIVESGLASLVEPDHTIDDGIRLVPTPGHTPAHASVEIASRGRRALISGDVLHHPCQLAFPGWGSDVDWDPELAVATRRRVLDELAGTGTILIGSHFAGSAAGTVVRRGAGFVLSPV